MNESGSIGFLLMLRFDPLYTLFIVKINFSIFCCFVNKNCDIYCIRTIDFIDIIIHPAALKGLRPHTYTPLTL